MKYIVLAPDHESNDIKPLFDGGLACIFNGNLVDAISSFTNVLNISPSSATAFVNRGTAYCIQGDFDSGIFDFTHALTLDPDDATSYNNRGLAYGQQGYFKQAVSDFTAAINIMPTNESFYFQRGMAYQEMGMYENALTDVLKAKELGYKIYPGCIGLLREAVKLERTNKARRARPEGYTMSSVDRSEPSLQRSHLDVLFSENGKKGMCNNCLEENVVVLWKKEDSEGDVEESAWVCKECWEYVNRVICQRCGCLIPTEQHLVDYDQDDHAAYVCKSCYGKPSADESQE